MKTNPVQRKEKVVIQRSNTKVKERELKADDILNAKVFNVSLKQLLPLKGSRSEIIQKTKSTRRKKEVAEGSQEVFYNSRDNRIRNAAEVDVARLGAPRVQAIIEGCMKGDALLDPGSHGSVISLHLVEELNLPIVTSKDATSNKMADGSVVKSLGEVENLLVSVQGVLFRVNPVVFKDPPYDILLGCDSIQVLELAVDYAKAHFSINTDKGIEPLEVSFKTPIQRMQRIEGASVISASDSDQSESSGLEDEISSSSSEEGSSTEEEYYLILPAFEEDKNGPVNELLLNEVEERSKDISNLPTSDEDKIQIIKDQMLSLDLEEDKKEKLQALLLENLEVFGVDYNDLKQTNLVKFHVDTGDHQPIMKRPNRHMSHSELESFKQELAKMLANGQLVPTMHAPSKDADSSLGWAFPAMYVGKRNTTEGRLVIQFQDLNAITKKDPWPLPSLTHLMEDYLGAEVFTTLDLLKGF
ncbi:hypothetical protein BD770DRAFT_333913, partial [Pilaira anomala]